MKKIVLLGLLAVLLTSSLQAQITQLTLTVNAANFPSSNCNLGGGAVSGNKVYLHSGLCTSDSALCKDSIYANNSPIWQHIVGNWGIDDGVGMMTFNSGTTYTIVIPIETYYTQNISSGSTAMPQGAIPYTIGMVFRNLDGTIEGKDEGCGDIFIVDIQSAQPLIRSGSGNINVPNISVSKAILAGVEDPSFIGTLLISPNPSADQVNVDFGLRKPAQALKASIVNSLGQVVAVLHDGKMEPGQQHLEWDGSQYAAGFYHLVVTEGGRPLLNENIVIAK